MRPDSSLGGEPPDRGEPAARRVGRYQITGTLGQGGMGIVYRAFDTLLQREVALKLISGNLESGPEQRERFFREARAAGQLSHPNIITIHDLGEHDGQPYLAMELLHGEDLQTRLNGPHRLSLAHKVDVMMQLCDGLDYAHARGVVHRDMKPANVFLTESGTAKILDFGLARIVSSELTDSNMMMGTVNYMAPEQVRGERADRRSDIFAVGVLFYELLGGRKAFDGDSLAATLYKILQTEPAPLSTIDSSLPADLIAIVDRALAKPRDERYQQMADMLRDLAVYRQALAAREPGSGGRLLSQTRVVEKAHSLSAPHVGSGGARSAASAPGSDVRGDPTLLQAAPATGSADETRVVSRARSRLWAAAALFVVGLAGIGWWAASRKPPSAPATPEAAPAVAPAASAPAQHPPDGGGAEAGKQASVGPDQAAPRQSTESGAGPAQGQAVAQARARMTEAKNAARAAGAPRLAAAAYQAALDAERVARSLETADRSTDATVKFYEASGLFRSAELSASDAAARAKPSQPAATPPAQPTPPAPQASAPQTPPPPATAPPPAPTISASQPPPSSAPQPGTPVAAVDHTPAAPAVVTPPRAAPAPAAGEPSAESAIGDVLGRYKAALEARSLDALKRVWPGLGGAQESALQSEFQHAARISVDLVSPRIHVDGATATATFVRRYELTTTDGQRLASASVSTMTLRRTPGGWVIDRLRFDPVR